MSESYWEEEANSLEIQLSELQEKYEELEQQKAELINLLCERCDYIGACEVEEILCAVKKYK